ncbi:MAG: GIY-YIG nuclease family protein [Chloroflexota bacterium]
MGDHVDDLMGLLTDPARRVPLSAFPRPGDRVDEPGLYAWYVDDEGAAALSRGLGTRVAPGLVYVGQTGAGASNASLRSRIGGNHRDGNVRGSTFRLTLAAILRAELGLRGTPDGPLAGDGEARLSRWMATHLEVAVAPYPDRARLAGVEDAILARLDAPLNLQGMPPSVIRSTLTRLRSALASASPGPAPLNARPARRAPVPRPAVSPVGDAPDIAAFLSGLVGQSIPTIGGKVNRILAIEDDVVLVATDRSPNGKPVQIAEVQAAANLLFERGELEISVATVGYRSAFVGAVLAALPGTTALLNPRRVRIGSSCEPPGPGGPL